MNTSAKLLELTTWQPSEKLVSRIKRFYRIALNDESVRNDSEIWDVISAKNIDIHEALMIDNDAAIKLLAEPDKSNLFYGYDSLCKDCIKDIVEDDKNPNFLQRHGQQLTD